MHRSSYLRMKYLLEHYEALLIKEKEVVKVLDVGSCDVNGTYRTLFDAPVYQYKGMDMTAGSNVDIVPKDIYHWSEIPDETFDLVVSGQVFEHIEYPWLTIKEIERVLKPSGVCILIAPSSGMEHKAPKDCYRYYADGLAALAKWADLRVCHISVGGVPKTDNLDGWINDWNDGCLVAQKRPYGDEDRPVFIMQEKRVPVYGSLDIWKEVVNQACRKFNSSRQIVLFGAGLIGGTVLDILGDDKVQFFIDNSQNKIGKEYKGKKVISFEEYQTVSNQYQCLITTSYSVSMEIKKQLEKAGIECSMLYTVYE